MTTPNYRGMAQKLEKEKQVLVEENKRLKDEIRLLRSLLKTQRDYQKNRGDING